MSNATKILILGATGYIGGSVLDALLKHPRASEFEITTFGRSVEKAKKLEELGLKTVTGPYSALEEAASGSDIIFNCASSDDPPMTEAILAGAKKHYASSHVPPVLIHTSGTGIVTDNALGQFASEEIYDDADAQTINSLPITQLHRNVDIPIVNAHKEGYIKSYIVYPSFIYGLATGRLVDTGIQNPVPTAIAIIAKAAIARGVFGAVGLQQNIWNVVDIHDLIDLFVLIFDAVLTGTKISAGPDGHYVGENGYAVTRQYNTAIARALYDLSLVKTPDTTELTQEELTGTIYPLFGSNSRTSSSRARSIGWKPVHTPEDFLKGIRQTIEVMTRKDSTSWAEWVSQVHQ